MTTKRILFLIFVLLMNLLYAQQSTSTNYQLLKYGFIGGNNQTTNTSTNYEVVGSAVGSISGEENASTSFIHQPGLLEGFNANFTVNSSSGIAPFAVQFADLSSGSPTSWQWDFENDGTIDSNEPNPTWIYDEPGTYTVSLMVSDGTNTDTETKIEYIQVFGTLTDIDGNVYQTVKIGNQLWMVENLKVEHYRNGEAVSHIPDNTTWTGLSTGAYCFYDNSSANGDTYGALYNWYAVDDLRNIAPDGWHVPTDDELTDMKNYLGNNAGSKLAGSFDLWNEGPLRNSSDFGASGFNLLPAGYRDDTNGVTGQMGIEARLWQSTQSSASQALGWAVASPWTSANRHNYSKICGFSVRCVKNITNFSVSDTCIDIGSELYFTNQSTGSATNWQWDFENDGTIDSYDQNPTWTYNELGVYSVSLTVIDGTDINTEIKTDFISIVEPAQISIDPDSLNFSVNKAKSNQQNQLLKIDNIGGLPLDVELFFFDNVTDIDGNEYKVVLINNQFWMAENLKVTHYRNGDQIPNVTDSNTWAGLSTGAYCYYDNDPANIETYGNLYNWYSVDDPRELAPEGWHVPTDDEIKNLEMYLGMSPDQANSTGYRGTNESSKLAGQYELWYSGPLRSNPDFGISGFNLLPGGTRRYNGVYDWKRDSGYLWSSTEETTGTAWERLVRCDRTTLYRVHNDKHIGFSIRCVKDNNNLVEQRRSNQHKENIRTDWLSFTPDILTAQPGSFEIVSFTVTTDTLGVGNYERFVYLSSNDPDNEIIELPLNITVFDLDTEFTVSDTSFSVGTSIQFTDESYGLTSSWEWDFDNDGTIDSSEQNPSWTYQEAGTYSVKLTIADSLGSDYELKTDYIVVTGSIYEEDFNLAGSLPADWTVTDGGLIGQTWDIEPDGADDWSMQVDGQFSGVCDDWLISPVIDCSFYTDVSLVFDNDYQDPANPDTDVYGGFVKYSLNGGSNWQDLYHYWNQNITETDTLAIPTADETDSLQIAFNYKKPMFNQTDYWNIDNFQIVGAFTDSLPPTTITDLVAENLSANSVTLTWTPTVEPHFSHYQVFYDTTAVDTTSYQWTTADDPALNERDTNTTTITGLESLKIYNFRIRSYDTYGYISELSNTASDTVDVEYNPPVISDPFPVQSDPWATAYITTIGCTITDTEVGIDPASVMYRIDYNGNGVYDTIPEEDWQTYTAPEDDQIIWRDKETGNLSLNLQADNSIYEFAINESERNTDKRDKTRRIKKDLTLSNSDRFTPVRYSEVTDGDQMICLAEVTYSSALVDGDTLRFEWQAADLFTNGPTYSGTNSEEGITDDWYMRLDVTPPTSGLSVFGYSPDSTSVMIGWDPISTDDFFATYQVYYWNYDTVDTTSYLWDSSHDPALAQSSTQYTTITGLIPNANYYFIIHGLDEAGNGGVFTSPYYCATTGSGGIPAEPASVTAEFHPAFVELNWDLGAESDLSYYRVFRDTIPEPSTAIDTVYIDTDGTIPILSYLDEDINSIWDSYYYRLTAVDEQGDESSYSDSVRVDIKNGSLLFDGDNDYVSVPDILAYDFIAGDDFSIFMWIKPDSLHRSGGPSGYRTSLIHQTSYGGPANKWFFYFHALTDSTAKLGFHAWNYNLSGAFDEMSDDEVHILDQWHNVGVTKGGSVYKFWFDGDIIGSFIYEDQLSNSGADLYIGLGNDHTTNCFDGQMDNIRIWNACLNESQILENMVEPYLIPDENHIVGCWQADILSDLELYDLSINSNNGTINDAVYEPINCRPFFKSNKTIVYYSDEVQFYDYSFSDLAINSWQWDFDNDGLVDSNEQNPTWTYNELGIYSVSLTVSDGINTETVFKIDYISVLIPAQISITPDSLHFDVSIGNQQSQDIVINNTGGLPLEVELSPVLTVKDIDGNVYQTVQIGDQIWMAENLKVTHYKNGDLIPNVTDNSTWANLSSGAYCYYNNDSSNEDTYGALYNWYAVDDSRGLAPEGWRVPTDDEIMELEMYLGMSQSQANSTGLRGTNEGSKLAGGYDLWQNGALRNDPDFGSSGFDFLPGGYRYSFDGYFYDLGSYGYFWSATEGNTFGAWYRTLLYNSTEVYRYGSNKRNGFSVRCIRDIDDLTIRQFTPLNRPAVLSEAYSTGFGNFAERQNDVLRGENLRTDWLSYLPTTLTIQPGESANVTVSIDAETLSFGDYSEIIYISSNDPDNPTIDFSVTMEVTSTVLEAAFTATSTSGNIPLTVTFTDESTPVDSISTWYWDFGDGADSTYTTFQSQILHEYETAGTFTVSLTVSDGTNNNTETKTDYITAEDLVPVLSVTPSNLDFGTDLTELELYIENTGTGDLTWQINEAISWLTATPASSGSDDNVVADHRSARKEKLPLSSKERKIQNTMLLTDNFRTEIDTVLITIDKTGLDPGVYSDSLLVTSNGGSDTIYVSMELLDTFPPSAPVGLVAYAGVNQATLVWNLNPEIDVCKYRIFRDITSPAITLIDSLEGSPPDTSYVDLNLTNYQTYYYRITAVDTANNESSYSIEVNATPYYQYQGPVWHISTNGSNTTGDGSAGNPYATIQYGIDNAAAGDTVLVEAGSYTENINFSSKNIIVASHYLTTADTTEISRTVIQSPQRSGSVVTMTSGEDSTAVLTGFSIIGGSGNAYQSGAFTYYYGGGIDCQDSNPTFKNLMIKGNEATYGGGIYLKNADVHIERVQITGNKANEKGGAAYIYQSEPEVTNATISGNMALHGGGIFIKDSAPVNLKNCIFWSNDLKQIAFGSSGQQSTITLDYSVVMNGMQGIDLGANYGTVTNPTQILTFSPLFVHPLYSNRFDSATTAGNFHLFPFSQCIDAGDPSSIYNDPDDTRNDIGAWYHDFGSTLNYFQNVLFVSANGNNSTGNGSYSNPFATIGHAMSLVQSNAIDSIIVFHGTYPENIQISTPVILGSLYLLDPYTVHVDSTIIDGGSPGNPNQGSSIAILGNAATDLQSESQIWGFKIQNGLGWQIQEEITYPNGQSQIISRLVGGGIFAWNCAPIIKYNIFFNNGNDNTYEGGALYTFIDDEDHIRNLRDTRTTLDYSHNIFYDNYAQIGKSISSDGFAGTIDLSNCEFDVFASFGREAGAVSNFWCNKDSLLTYDFTNITGREEAITNNPTISPDTLGVTLSKVYADELNPVTINLSSGTTRRGRDLLSTFPLQMVDHVSIAGAGAGSTVIDAENSECVLMFDKVEGVKVEQLKLTQGDSEIGGGACISHSEAEFSDVTIDSNTSDVGGGIFSKQSTVIFNSVTLSNNTSESGMAGGIYLEGSSTNLLDVELSNNQVQYVGITEDGYGGGIFAYNTDLVIENLVIEGNQLSGINTRGGGIYLLNSEGHNSNVTIRNVEIRNNSAVYGGGIALFRVNPLIERVLITGNTAFDKGGAIYCFDSHPVLRNTTIADNSSDSGVSNGIYITGQGNTNPGIDIMNTILWDAGLYQVTLAGGPKKVSLAYTDIDSVYYRTGDIVNIQSGNINADPLFADALNGDYHLTSSSPCIDAGNPDLAYNDPDGTRNDMGMYYFAQIIQPSQPENVNIQISSNIVYISWDAVDNTTSYKVYSSDYPDTGFTEDATGTFSGESWSTSIVNERKFYRVTAVNEVTDEIQKRK